MSDQPTTATNENEQPKQPQPLPQSPPAPATPTSQLSNPIDRRMSRMMSCQMDGSPLAGRGLQMEPVMEPKFKMDRWEGKVAVVTGASGGIGAAIARDLCHKGMIVCGLARRKDKVEALRAGLFGATGQINAVECDITKEEDVLRAFNWIEKVYGGVDMLINNAGVISQCLLTDRNNLKDLKRIMETNIIGLCLCTRESIRSMAAREVRGHIVNINSIFGHKIHASVPGTRPLNGMYPASKYAVTAITECIRQELVFLGTDIKVTSISPGLTNQDILADAKNDLIKLMPRLEPQDVSDAVMFAIATPEHVQIQEIVIKPMGEFL